MKVSVIISSYNCEKYVCQAVESVLAQTHRDIELVVVDDGSKDRSLEMLSRYRDRATVLSKPNGGQASALNLGYRYITGDLVMFLDCDDLLDPRCFEKTVAAWRPGVSKIHFQMRVVDSNGDPTGGLNPRTPVPSGDLLPELLRTGLYISPPCSGNIYSREYLDRIMPIEEARWSWGPDTYPIMLAPFHGEILAIDEPLASYRRHQSSYTSVTLDGAEELYRKLQRMLANDRNTLRLIQEAARERGLEGPSGSRPVHWLQTKQQLAMWKLESLLGRARDCGRAGAFAKAMRTLWSASDSPVTTRLEITLWAMAMLASPARISVPLVRFAFAPGDRARVLRQILTGVTA